MATDSPVYNRLQSVFYRLPFMYDLWATATATDRNSGQPDRKSGCLRSIFRSGPVQFPVYMTGLSNTTCVHFRAMSLPHSERHVLHGAFWKMTKSGSSAWRKQSQWQQVVSSESYLSPFFVTVHHQILSSFGTHTGLTFVMTCDISFSTATSTSIQPMKMSRIMAYI